MSPTLTCLALAMVGVDLGYRPAPQGGVEFVVQIAPSTLATLQPGDPIPLTVPREAQQARARQITLTLGTGPVPRILPAPDSSPAAAPPAFQSTPGTTAPPFRVGPPGVPSAPPYRSAPPDMSAAPGRAPDVPALPVLGSTVTTAGAAMPLASPENPDVAAANGQGPVRVAPPSGTPVAPATTGEQGQLIGQAADSSSANGQPGNRFGSLAPVGGNGGGTTMDTLRLVLYLVIIALAASNGYWAWLFLDARQRYIGLVSQTFATAK